MSSPNFTRFAISLGIAYCLATGTLVAADLTRGTAQRVLQQQISASANTLGPGNTFFAKPEFASLRNKVIYDVRIEVTGVHQLSATEAAAEWHLIATSHKPATAEWVAAFERFRARVAANRTTHGAMTEYTDPSDGQRFVAVATTRKVTIFDSLDWKKLEPVYERMKTIVTQGSWTTPTATAKLSLYDDGWRVAKSQ